MSRPLDWQNLPNFPVSSLSRPQLAQSKSTQLKSGASGKYYLPGRVARECRLKTGADRDSVLSLKQDLERVKAEEVLLEAQLHQAALCLLSGSGSWHGEKLDSLDWLCFRHGSYEVSLVFLAEINNHALLMDLSLVQSWRSPLYPISTEVLGRHQMKGCLYIVGPVHVLVKPWFVRLDSVSGKVLVVS